MEIAALQGLDRPAVVHLGNSGLVGTSRTSRCLSHHGDADLASVLRLNLAKQSMPADFARLYLHVDISH